MSEYQYYEFCNINQPLMSEARKAMHSLSSRAKVTTHGASYVYNYGDFRGDPKALVLTYFDVFFYISNFGCIQLMFKYGKEAVNTTALNTYCVKDIIRCETHDSQVLLAIDFDNEDGFGWVEGEGMLPDLLPLYDEVKAGNYQFLRLVAKASAGSSLHNASGLIQSQAQGAFCTYAGIDSNMMTCE